MKKIILAGAAALTILATPAAAQTTCVTDPTTGLLVGTAVGVGTGVAVYNGYIVSSAAGAALGTAGAAAVGGVAGVGTIALFDMFTSPCRGFRLMFGPQPVVMAPGSVR